MRNTGGTILTNTDLSPNSYTSVDSDLTQTLGESETDGRKSGSGA
jgi:hypothetical protein